VGQSKRRLREENWQIWTSQMILFWWATQLTDQLQHLSDSIASRARVLKLHVKVEKTKSRVRKIGRVVDTRQPKYKDQRHCMAYSWRCVDRVKCNGRKTAEHQNRHWIPERRNPSRPSFTWRDTGYGLSNQRIRHKNVFSEQRTKKIWRNGLFDVLVAGNAKVYPKTWQYRAPGRRDIDKQV